MALIPISTPAFPNVPNAPGVPPVLRQIGAVASTATLLIADVRKVINAFSGGAQWGLFFPSGQPALVGVDSTIAVDVRRDYATSDYPVEQGGFETYNKVIRPREIRVEIAVSGAGSLLSSIGGSLVSLITGNDPQVANRGRTIDAMHALADSLAPLDIRTPEGAYGGYTIEHYDYRREARGGISLIKVDIWLREIRQAAKNAFTTEPAKAPDTATPPTITDPKTAGASLPTNSGAVQPSVITEAQASTLPSGPGSDPGIAGGPGGGGVTPTGSDTQPYFDSSGKQLGIAPTTTPIGGPIVGEYANGQPVIGGAWQHGFYDQAGNWIK
jgi:hypothetical protein